MAFQYLLFGTASVDNVADVGDGEGSLRDVCGHNNEALPGIGAVVNLHDRGKAKRGEGTRRDRQCSMTGATKEGEGRKM